MSNSCRRRRRVQLGGGGQLDDLSGALLLAARALDLLIQLVLFVRSHWASDVLDALLVNISDSDRLVGDVLLVVVLIRDYLEQMVVVPVDVGDDCFVQVDVRVVAAVLHGELVQVDRQILVNDGLIDAEPTSHAWWHLGHGVALVVGWRQLGQLELNLFGRVLGPFVEQSGSLR